MLSNLDHHELLVFWVQLLVLYVFARGLGFAARRVGLPSVVGELTAGLVLGPSVFGLVWPDGFHWFLPHSEISSGLLLGVVWFGAAFLLVVAGFETDLDLITRLGRPAMMVTIGSIFVPLAGGLIVGPQLPDSLRGADADTLVFTLFIAISVAVSALAVVAKILGDLGLMRRDVGQITVAVGMANDLFGWIVLGIIAGLAASGGVSVGQVAFTVIGLGLFLAGALTVGQRGVDAALRTVRRGGSNVEGALTVAIGTMFIFGVITQWLGVEAVLGAFVAGVVLAASRYKQIDAEHAIEQFTSVLFAPLFFATAGLRLDLGLLRGDALLWTLVLLAVALGLKFVGAYGGARIGGLSSREGIVLGAGLNARGALEIIIATVGLSLGVFNDTSFTMIVLIPLITSLFASVVVRSVGENLEGTVAERERLAQEAALSKNLVVRDERFLLPSAGGPNSIVAAQLLQFIWPESADGTLVVVEPDGVDVDVEPIRNVLWGREIEEVAATPETARDVIIAQSRLGFGVIAVGAAEETEDPVTTLVDSLLGQVDKPIVIVRRARGSRLPGIFARALVPVVGNTSSRAAEEVAGNLSNRLGTELVLSHVVYRPDAASDASIIGRIRGTAFPPDLGVAEKLLARAQSHVAELNANSPHTEIRFAVSPADEILAQASEVEADLIVLGAQLRRLEGEAFLGHNVEHILENAPQTVVVVAIPDQLPD